MWIEKDYLMMIFRVLQHKRHNFSNQYLLRRVIEILRVFQKREKNGRQLPQPLPLPLPLNLNMTLLFHHPLNLTLLFHHPLNLRLYMKLKLNLHMNLRTEIEIEPPYELSHQIETNTETEIEPKHQTEPPKTITFNVLTRQELMEKIKPPKEISVHQDQPLSHTKNLESAFNETQSTYNQTPLQTPTVNPIISETVSHVATHLDNKKVLLNLYTFSNCNHHFTDFNVTGGFHDFEMKDLSP